MSARALRFPALVALLALAAFVAVWLALSARYPILAHGEPPDAGVVTTTPPTASTVTPPPAPEDDASWWASTGWDAARSSVPLAALLLAFAAVTVVRRHWKQAREGTTGVLTAAALAFLGVVTGGLLAGVSLGTALGWGISVLVGGKALATVPVKA